MQPGDVYDVLSAPLGDLIANVGRGVADAQQAMDRATLEQLERLYASNEEFASRLRDLGYRPTWYHIPSAEAELQVALKLSGTVDYSSGSVGKRALKAFAAPVDASYRNTYDYDVSAASTIKFTIVPIPEPAQLEARGVVPELTDMPLADAEALLTRLGIPYRLADDAVTSATVARTEPVAGTVLEPGADVLLVPATSE